MQWPYVLGLGYSIVLAFVYVIGQLTSEFMLVFSNIIFPATSGFAFFVSFWVMERYVERNPKPMFSMAWVSFSSGLFMWFIGELYWAIYVLILQADPFPSFADVLFLAGYFPIFFMVFLVLKLFGPAFSKRTVALQLGVSMSSSAVVSSAMIVPIAQSSENLATIAVAAAYPILDVGLFALALTHLIVFFKGSIGKAWFFITLGFILNIVTDLAFTYAELQGFFYEGHPLELFWLWGYVAFMLGIYIHRREL